MASQLSHMIAGTAALKRALPRDQATILAQYGSWFRLGCQGPDIFYHNQRTRPLSIYYGSLLHKHSMGIFIASLAKNLLLAPENPESTAFLLGFAAHAALDRSTHPYIVYHSGWYDPLRPDTKPYKGAHVFLERILDVLLWEQSEGKAISDFHQAELLVPKTQTPAVLESALAMALTETYPRRAGKDEQLLRRISNGFLDTAHIFSLTDPSHPYSLAKRRFAFHDEGSHSIAMLYPRDIPRDIDWANGGRVPWRHPFQAEKTSEASYFDLVESAVAETVPLMAALGGIMFSRCGQDTARNEKLAVLAAAIGNASLNISDDQGMQKAPLRSLPLPVYPFMKQVYEKILSDLR